MLKNLTILMAHILPYCALQGSDGKITELHNAYLIYDMQHGALIENRICPWLSTSVLIENNLIASKRGKAFLDAFYGNGRLGMTPKYLVIDGVAVKNDAQSGELKLVSVSRFFERAYDPAARAVKINKTRGCGTRRK